MELKLCRLAILTLQLARFNRTFMELKFKKTHAQVAKVMF